MTAISLESAENSLIKLATRLGVAVDGEHFRQSLTHRSAAKQHNERLEFLGDSVLNCVVTIELYARFPRSREGELTRRRAQLIQELTLAEIAREIDLGDALCLGPGELKTGGHRRDSILADALEAVIASVHLDHGWKVAYALVVRLMGDRLSKSPQIPAKDAKTQLQEWLQGKGTDLPQYALVDTVGQDHQKTFIASCTIAEPAIAGEGKGSSRRAAEQSAAATLLKALRQ